MPPSGPLIVFALLTEASVGRLFIGAFGPALLSVVLYCATAWLYVHLSPQSCPPATRAGAEEIGKQLWKCRTVGLLFLVVMGGLYLGIFTDTESAAVGAVGAFLAALFRGKLKGQSVLAGDGRSHGGHGHDLRADLWCPDACHSSSPPLH